MLMPFFEQCCDGDLHMTSGDFGSCTSKKLESLKRNHRINQQKPHLCMWKIASKQLRATLSQTVAQTQQCRFRDTSADRQSCRLCPFPFQQLSGVGHHVSPSSKASTVCQHLHGFRSVITRDAQRIVVSIFEEKTIKQISRFESKSSR